MEVRASNLGQHTYVRTPLIHHRKCNRCRPDEGPAGEGGVVDGQVVLDFRRLSWAWMADNGKHGGYSGKGEGRRSPFDRIRIQSLRLSERS